METFDRQLVIVLKVFKGMHPPDSFDMNKICDRLRYAFHQKGISYRKAAKELGVSRDLIFDYTNQNYPEKSMQVRTLIKFAGYFGKERYYFCNEYHKFLDTEEAGRLLRKVRRQHNMTQKQFSCWLGVSLTCYKTYESGRCKLPLEVFNKFK